MSDGFELGDVDVGRVVVRGQRHLEARDYTVRDVEHRVAAEFVREHHYSRGCSNTQVYGHGLFEIATGRLVGVAMWLPPTRVAAESVNKDNWRRVVALSRLAVHPDVPTNGASFLMGRSIRLIRKDGRFLTLVTYADESQGHTGTIYRATNWIYAGRTGPYPRWVSAAGKQVATLATKTRTKAQMEALGHVRVGSFHKHKFVLHLT